MLRFDEETKVCITNQDFKHVKPRVLAFPEQTLEECLREDSEPVQGKMDTLSVTKKTKVERILKERLSTGFTLDPSKPRKSIRRQNSFLDVSTINLDDSITRTRSKSINRDPSADKFEKVKHPTGSFMIRRGSTVSAEKRPSISGKLFQLTQNHKSTVSFDLYRSSKTISDVESLHDAWKCIIESTLNIANYIKSRAHHKMFTRDCNKRSQRIIEKKKDELATKHMQQLELKYGKKITKLYNKGKRFTYMKEYYEQQKAYLLNEIVFYFPYLLYELTKLEESFNYDDLLIRILPDQLEESVKNIPKLNSNQQKMFFTEKTVFWPIKNLQSYKYYVYEADNLIAKILKYTVDKNRLLIKKMKRYQQEGIQDTTSNDELISLENLIHFKGSTHKILKLDRRDLVKSRVLKIIADKVKNRIDWQLVKLFLGYSFFLYFCGKRNLEKGYVYLTRAYEENKSSINTYLSTYTKYICARDQLVYFLDESERRHPDPATYPNLSYTEYLRKMIKLDTRLPYIYDLIENSLSVCISVVELKEIFKAAGKMALELKDYYRAVLYFENYLFILDSVDRLNMQRHLDKGKAKDVKVNEILLLNKSYMKYHNRVLKACFETQQYVKALTLIVNILFIFNNSLNLINYYDPNSHPTKKPNSVIMMDIKTFDKISEGKKYYKNLMVFYIKEWRVATDFHSKIWDIISQAQNKHRFKQAFFLGFRESINYVEKLTIYNLSNYLEFLKQYTNIPSVLDTVENKERQDKDTLEKLSLQQHETEKQMDYYFPTYVGGFDKNFVEIKILEWVYMNKENHNRLSRVTSLEKLMKKKRLMEDTKAFKKKRIEKLNVWEVLAYYTLDFEDKMLARILFRYMIRRFHEARIKQARSTQNGKQLLASKENFKDVAKITKENEFKIYFDSVMNDADSETKNSLRYQIGRFMKHLVFLRDERKRLYEESLHRRLLTWKDKVVARHMPYESQDTINLIRCCEVDMLNSQKYKKSRFFKEMKTHVAECVIEFHLNEYYTTPVKRKSIMIEPNKSHHYPPIIDIQMLKHSTDTKHTFSDYMNISILSKGFYCLRNYIRFVKSLENRKQSKVKVKHAFGKINIMRSKSKIMSGSLIPSTPQSSGPQTKKFVQNDAADYQHIEESLSAIQSRDYKFESASLFGQLTRFFCKCSILSDKLIFSGDFKPAKSPDCFKYTLVFPLSKNLIKEKEQFIVNYNYVFESYWPIIFAFFKEDFTTRYFSSIPDDGSPVSRKKTQNIYKKFIQDLGLGFEIQYSNYKEPVSVLKDKEEYQFYKRGDFQSLQLMINNINVFIDLLDYTLRRKPLGFAAEKMISVDTLLPILAKKHCSIGEFYFLKLKLKEKVQTSRKLREKILTKREEILIAEDKEGSMTHLMNKCKHN